jgi:hypothetical protein
MSINIIYAGFPGLGFQHRTLRKHIQVVVVQISTCGLLYFWSYTRWKIGFVASPKTSLKHVFWVKML